MNYIFKTLPTRKYNQTNLTTGKTERVTVTNRNNLSIEKQIELLNKYDTEHLYTEIPSYKQE